MLYMGYQIRGVIFQVLEDQLNNGRPAIPLLEKSYGSNAETPSVIIHFLVDPYFLQSLDIFVVAFDRISCLVCHWSLCYPFSEGFL